LIDAPADKDRSTATTSLTIWPHSKFVSFRRYLDAVLAEEVIQSQLPVTKA
jgi:hypothetical protein